MAVPLDRRRFVRTVGAAGVVGLAGCLGSTDDDPGNDDESRDDGTSGETDDSADDERDDDRDVDSGAVYAFGPNVIAVIDPDTGDVIEELTDGLEDESWGDTQITHDHRKLFAVRQSPSQVVVLDTATHEILETVDVGPGPVHVYHPTDDAVWVHADDEGTFYVVDVDTHAVVETVESGLDREGHGKLLAHEALGSIGFATNVTDPGLPVIDLDSFERTDFVELGADGGTHYKAYGPQNGLVYAEFGDVTAVVDPDELTVVDELDVSGGMYLTPDEERLGILDGDEVRFVDVTTDASEELGTVTVEGGPDALRYHRGEDGTLYGYTANTMNDRAAVIDVDALEVIDELDVGDIVRPEGAPFLHRTAMAADGVFVTPAEDDGFVAVVDMDAREVRHRVAVEEGVDTVQIVADAGTGYTGRTR